MFSIQENLCSKPPQKEPMDQKIPTRSISFPTHKEALKSKKSTLWNQLEKISVQEAISLWLGTLNGLTQDSYAKWMNRLIEMDLVSPEMNLQTFSLVNQNVVVDKIKLVAEWTETTKQSRAACFISFTGFLDQRTEGVIKKAVPSREGVNRTFFKVRDEVTTKALNQSQWLSFLSALDNINHRDCLIAKTILQGAKRKSEVLELRLS